LYGLQPSGEEIFVRIHNLYVDDQGETHFRDIEVEWVTEGPGGKMSALIPATGIMFRATPGTYDYSWHPAPRRQYIINLDGAVRVTVSDGESRVIGPGEVFLVEDTHGKGHISQAVDGTFRHSIFVPIE
jgi:hypothetical protein